MSLDIDANAEKEWVHFGLTSQDINNTSIPLSWKDCLEHDYLPAIINLQKKLNSLADQWKNIPMLAHTHGQPASRGASPRSRLPGARWNQGRCC